MSYKLLGGRFKARASDELDEELNSDKWFLYLCKAGKCTELQTFKRPEGSWFTVWKLVCGNLINWKVVY